MHITRTGEYGGWDSSHSENVSLSHVQREWDSRHGQRIGQQSCTVYSGQQSFAEDRTTVICGGCGTVVICRG